MFLSSGYFGKEFQFLDAWNILRIDQKFMHRRDGNGYEIIAFDGIRDGDQVVSIKQKRLTVPDIASKEMVDTTRDACRPIERQFLKEREIKMNMMMKNLKLTRHLLD